MHTDQAAAPTTKTAEANIAIFACLGSGGFGPADSSVPTSNHHLISFP